METEWPASPGPLSSLKTRMASVLALWHRNFQLSARTLHDILEFFIIRINEINTTQSSGSAVSRLPTFASLCVSMPGLEVVCFLVNLSLGPWKQGGRLALGPCRLSKLEWPPFWPFSVGMGPCGRSGRSKFRRGTVG